MILPFILLFVASAIIFSLLLPKPNIENAVAQEFSEDGFPKSTENSPIPYLIGKARLESPNTLFAGNFRVTPITERIRVGLFKKRTITKGYRYFLTIDLGFCLGGGGAGVTLHEIWIDNSKVWEGTLTGVSSSSVSAGSLFGGDERGGGFTSNFTFYPGTINQPVNAFINNLPGSLGLQTPYRGVSHIVFQDAYIGESPQLRNIAIVASRFTNTLGLTGGKNVVGTEMVNLAEGMYELMVNQYGGLGAAPGLLDFAAFQDAANVLHGEGQGLAGVIQSDSTGENVIKEFLKQADALLTIDPSTNKVKPFLLRRDYDISTLPVLGESDITQIDRFTQTLWSELVSEVKVGFRDPAKDYQNVTAVAQDLAVANITGKLKSVSVSLPFCKDVDLANSIAGRELNQLSQIVTQVRFKVNRTAYTLAPGAVFRWSWPDYGITNMVLRTKEVVDGDDETPLITIDAVRDTYDNTNNPFLAPAGGVTTPISQAAAQVTAQSTIEAHRFFIINSPDIESPDLTTAASYPIVLPQRANAAQVAFDLGMDSEIIANNVLYPISGNITSGDISPQDSFDDMVITSISLSGIDQARQAELDSEGIDAVREGSQLFFLNGELMGYETYTDNGGGNITLNNVHRALLNTRQQDHSDGDVVTFFDYSLIVNQPTPVADTPVDIQYMSTNGPTILSILDSTIFRTAVVGAQAYPDPPDDIQINASRTIPNDIKSGDSLDVTWVARDKSINSIRLSSDDADTRPSGMTYTIQLWNITQSTGPDLETTGLTTPAETLTVPSDYASLDRVEIRVYSVEGGLTSREYEFFPFQIAPPDEVLLSGDQQSGGDRELLSGDQQSGTDALDLSGDQI